MAFLRKLNDPGELTGHLAKTDSLVIPLVVVVGDIADSFHHP